MGPTSSPTAQDLYYKHKLQWDDIVTLSLTGLKAGVEHLFFPVGGAVPEATGREQQGLGGGNNRLCCYLQNIMCPLRRWRDKSIKCFHVMERNVLLNQHKYSCILMPHQATNITLPRNNDLMYKRKITHTWKQGHKTIQDSTK